MSNKINWETRGAFVEFYQQVSLADFEAVSLELQNHSEFDNLRYIICSLLDMTSMDYSVEDVERQIHFDRVVSQSSAQLKNAFVATHEDALTLGSYYQQQMSDTRWDCRFFSSMEEARAWIEE